MNNTTATANEIQTREYMPPGPAQWAKHPWLITCASGRAFIVYETDSQRASLYFARAVEECGEYAPGDVRDIRGEKIADVRPHLEDTAMVFIDNRKSGRQT